MTEQARYYFWNGREVVSVASFGDLVSPGNPSRHDGQFCIDTGYTNLRRYGMFDQPDGTWKNRPLHSFPPEFRMHLLLLGVS